MKILQRSFHMMTLLSLAAAQACSAPINIVANVDGSAIPATSTSSATPLPPSPAAPNADAVDDGADELDELEDAIDELEAVLDEWEAFDWAEKSADYDWEASDDEVALGLAVRDIHYFGGSDEDQDGALDYHALAYVKAGKAEHRIELDENNEPVSSDKPDVLRLTDRTASDASTFIADQEFNGFTVQHEGAELAIAFTDGDEIVVDGEAYAGIDAAAAAIVAHPVGQGVSLHSLSFLQGLLLRRPAEATRGAPACNAPMAGTIERDEAQVYRLPVRYKVQSVQDPAAEQPHALVKAVIALRKER